MARKITPSIEREVLTKAAQGETTRTIAEWIGSAHGIKISHQAVGKLLRQTRTERADVAKVVVREVLTKSVTADLERLERLAAKAEEIANLQETDPDVWVKLADTVRKISETKLHFSGADSADGNNDGVTLSDLTGAMRALEDNAIDD